MVLVMNPNISVLVGGVLLASGGFLDAWPSSFFDAVLAFSCSCRRCISRSFSASWWSRVVRGRVFVFSLRGGLERDWCDVKLDRELRDVRLVLESCDVRLVLESGDVRLDLEFLLELDLELGLESSDVKISL